ncbi:MAG: hypothetical protein QOH61_630 [Chloroflexota bacterium]|jgi:UPF0755 protein|nr:hypothetical protein [Chloroflexota bacterium]
MTLRGGGSSPRDGRGIRQGSITRGSSAAPGYRARRGGATWRGVIFLLVLAVAVVGLGLFVAAPAFRTFARGLANDNAQALGYPFVADVVKQDLGDALTKPAGTAADPIRFTVETGAGVRQIGVSLTQAGLIREPMVFQYLVVTQGLDGKVQTGVFTLRKTMTPQQIVDRLLKPPDPVPVTIGFSPRLGLRIEQLAALLVEMQQNPETGSVPLTTDVAEFYDIAQHPPADLIADYPFLSTLPAGNSLEGFLSGGVYTLPPGASADDIVRTLLDGWQTSIGPDVVKQAQDAKLDFYQVLTVASIVERETGTDAERAKIAGVYWNRLDHDLNRTQLMNADPTVIYAVDTDKLAKTKLDTWNTYTFWLPVGSSLNDVTVSPDLQSFQTYQTPGLPAWPIATPSKASILAAISPDTKDKYLYFYACPGSDKHKFAKTLAQHNQNIASC